MVIIKKKSIHVSSHALTSLSKPRSLAHLAIYVNK